MKPDLSLERQRGSVLIQFALVVVAIWWFAFPALRDVDTFDEVVAKE